MPDPCENCGTGVRVMTGVVDGDLIDGALCELVEPRVSAGPTVIGTWIPHTPERCRAYRAASGQTTRN